jgi:hypothetical protein
MKTTLRLILAAGALLAAQAVQAGVLYNYSYTFADGAKMSGSFTGDASGNIVSNLSNITASVDGVELVGSGHLYAASFTDSGWSAGTGEASFDGTENNFLFIDVDYPNNVDYTNFVYAIRGGGQPTSRAAAYVNGTIHDDFFVTNTGYDASHWSLTEADANAVPEPASLAILGLGLAGLCAARRARRHGAA